MIGFLYFLLIFVNCQICSMSTYGKSRITWHDWRSCSCSKYGEIEGNGNVKNRENSGEYNCGVMGVVKKIPYHPSLDYVHVSFSSACVKCGLCIAIVDKINKTLMTLHDVISCDRYLGSAECMLETFCEDSFLGYRLREVGGERYIGDNVPGSLIVKSTGDGLWEKNLKDKCEEIMSTIGREYLLKYLRDGCKDKKTDLTDILCHGKMGASKDCRGIM